MVKVLPVNNQLKAGAILNYVLIFLNTLVGLLYTPYMLRTMGQNEYGLYSIVASVISYLTILDLGMGNAIIRYTAKFRAEGKKEEQYEMFGLFIVLYIIIGLIAMALGMVLYFNVDAMFGQTMSAMELSRARIMILILIFNLAFTFPMSIFGSKLTAYEEFVFPRVVNIIRIILNTVVMIVLLHYGYRAVAMVVVQTIFNILTLVLNYVYCKHHLQIKLIYWHFNWGFLKEVAVYSFWILLNVIMDKVYWSTGQFVLGAVSGTIAVSVFAVAIQLESMYMQFSTAISSVFLPKVTAIVSTTNNDKILSDLFIRTGRLQYIVMCFILSGFIVFGRPFIKLWAGPEYSDAYIITLLFFVSLIIPLIQNLGIVILQAKNQMKFRSLLYIGIAAIALLFEIILAKKLGGIGCAIAIAGALLLGQGLIMNIYYKRVQGIDIVRFWKEILRMTLIPAFLVSLSLFFVRSHAVDTWYVLILYIILFAVLYISLIFAFSLNSYERELFITPIKRIFSGRS